MKKKAIVFGATGYTGREVVRILAEQGVETIAHVRPDSSRGEEWRERFESQSARVDRSPWELSALESLLGEEAPDGVFFLIGTTRKRDQASEADESYEAIDYGLCQLVVDACVSSGQAPLFVYLSAMGVRPGSPSAYYKARWKAEEAVRGSGLPAILARPGMITGPGRDDPRPLERLGGALADVAAGGLRLLGAKRTADRWASTDNTELATALVGLYLGGEARGAVEAEDLKGWELH